MINRTKKAMKNIAEKKYFKNATLILVLVNVIVFIIQQIFPWITNMFLLNSADVMTRPWILITSMFLHSPDNITHLIFNMYALFIFGSLIERKIGTKRFVSIYFIAGIIAAIFSTLFYARALGASGAIMAILGITIILMPDLRVLFFFMIPMSLRTAGIIFALMDIAGLFYSNGIANAAHLAGLAVGLAYGYYLMKKKLAFNKNFVGTASSNSGEKARVFVEGPRDTNKQDMSQQEINDYIKYGRL